MDFKVGQTVFFPFTKEGYPGDVCTIKAIDEGVVWLRNVSASPMRVYMSISIEELKEKIAGNS